jgi:hypothetical protein
LAIWYIFGHLVYFVDIWYILWPFGTFCGQLVYVVAIRYFYGYMYLWYIFYRFGILYQEKSGNPASVRSFFTIKSN